MYLKYLKIKNQSGVIRDIKFHQGLNLIVDETPDDNHTETGNGVGKTTVLRLIDFCLGKDGKYIYTDPNDNKSQHIEVKDFLQKTNVEIELSLTRNWEKDDLIICRSFVNGKNSVRTVNGVQCDAKNFDDVLSEKILGFVAGKPSFRQIISHNIRYSEPSLGQVLKTLAPFARDTEYETLYLFMFGCRNNDDGKRKDLMDKLNNEKKFLKRLVQINSKSAYRSLLGLVDTQIEKLEEKKKTLNLHPDFEKAINDLNNVKFKLNSLVSEISSLKLRRETILAAQRELEEERSDIDTQQLAEIYKQAKSLIPGLQKTFEDLLSYHNKMIASRLNFITISLPSIDEKIGVLESEITKLRKHEKELTDVVVLSETYEDFEQLISEQNERYKEKGEYESKIQQIESVERSISEINLQLNEIEEDLFSEDYTNNVQSQLDKFNRLFTQVSKDLYDEEYVLKFDIENFRDTSKKIYKFSSFNANLSSGKKMGEISCFDIAYTIFARENGIPHLPFLLNDKRELMSDNQLVAIADIVNQNNIQFVASILKDKLPEELKNEEYYILKLSEHDKLFRV